MFKLESYITPVILSYVEKYVKNFKPEQSQVSLWGGDASFQNLDLRLEVLEEQLNLPFTFVSGHIHELLIHVPWVKITSEPIVVTINTIECILKLKDQTQSENVSSPTSSRRSVVSQEEAPPGYIKSIVTKVINNITINCNNLILKYVEEDIVLSINVRFLSMQTVNDKWEPAFTDISNYEMKLQKIVSIQDLTLCLDKMDTSGKIEIYQDPVLYRCSMTIRLIMSYHSNTAKQASKVRLDLHCQKMEFSITEQQIPMILRLVALLNYLQSGQYANTRDRCSISVDESETGSNEDAAQVTNIPAADGWGMWAWNTMSAILPLEWDSEWSNEDRLAYADNVIHCGFYIDDATITFKTVESVKEQLFYKSKKIKYKSFLSLRFSEAVLDAVMQGIFMTNFTIGFGTIRLYPRGTCSCGFLEVADGMQPPLYLVAGESNSNYLKDTLFDDDALENQGKRRVYKKDVAHNLTTYTVQMLLERCPAFCMNYIHYVETPEDFTPEKIAEFAGNYEYSNFHEERYIRYGLGNLTLRLCSGLLHRTDAIKQAADKYDYTPHVVAKPLPSFEELPPVTVEEYDALRENTPMVKTSFYVTKSAIQFQFADHRVTGLPRQRKFAESRILPLTPSLSDDPFLSLECDVISATWEQPLYAFRLIACASKQTDIPAEMLAQCYRNVEVQLQGIKSQVYLKPNIRTSIVTPSNAEYNFRSLLFPDYWKNPNTIHYSHNLKIDSVTFTGTKTKIMVASSIVDSLLHPSDSNNPLLCSSLFTDACNEKSPVFIELCLENITHEGISSASITSGTMSVNSVKMFAHNETQQVFILSGPETDDQSPPENQKLVNLSLQFPKDPSNPRHPTLLSLQIASTKGCFDPLLLQWLDYRVTYYKLNTPHLVRSDSVQTTTDNTSVDNNTASRKKTFPSLHESVHSSSDKEKLKMKADELLMRGDSFNEEMTSMVKPNTTTTEGKTKIAEILAEYHPWWDRLIFVGSIGNVTVYMPTKSISGIGAEGIEQAKEQALKNDAALQILVIRTPIFNIHSSNITPDPALFNLHKLPIIIPKKFRVQQSHSFPWTIEITNFECFTLKSNSLKNFIKKVYFKATFDLTAKNSTTAGAKEKLSTLSLCLYIDTSPIVVSISEEQVMFLYSTFTKIASLIQTSPSRKISEPNRCSSKEIKDISFTAPRSSSSPTQLPYPEDATTTSSISAVKDNASQDEDDLQLTACIQWTITKVAVKLYVMGECDRATLKLVLELEDIITSVDIQSVYFKLKHKITTGTILHYKRGPQAQTWDSGDYVGLILCGKEDNFEKSEDSGFMSLTLTVAQSGNVHTRWGARKSYKSQKRDTRTEVLQATNAFITEAIVRIQTIDLILPPNVLAKYMQFARPFLESKKPHYDVSARASRNASSPFAGITSLRNDSLPLIYFEFKGIRVMLPVASESLKEFQHDLLMLQLDGIRITPQAENPICRAPLRPDIYQLAAQANILNVPGSAVEDRQYQINVDGICAHTTTWKDYQQSVTQQMSQSYLYTMNENPAVEWNKLGNGSSLEPHFSTLPVITRFDFSFIIAPVVIFKPDTMVCASAAEINCLTDLELMVNLDQIKLASTLAAQLQNLTTFEGGHEQMEIFETPSFTRRTSVALDYRSNFPIRQAIVESEADYAKDSGVDFEMSSINSANLDKPLLETSEFLPFEFLINCGKITMIIYDIKKPGDAHCDSSKIKLEKDEMVNLKQPLLYAMANQPNFYFSQQHFDKKMQASCFDIALQLGDKSAEPTFTLPNESSFKVCLVETKSGEAHPDTGIPPSFLVVKCDMLIGKNPQFYVEIGRPTKLHASLSRLNDLLYIKDKVAEYVTSDPTSKRVDLPASIPSPRPSSAKSSTGSSSIPDVTITSKQLVLSFKSESHSELLFSLASLSGSIASIPRPERIFSTLSWDSLVISAMVDSRLAVLLNPCSCNASVNFVKESWLTNGSGPVMQVQAEADCLYLDVGPKHVLAVKDILADVSEMTARLRAEDEAMEVDEDDGIGVTTHEQHYKDDLKSGAFQFVDGNSDELPFPYQVVFSSSPKQAMAWRYPHPRALTRIHVSPVPIESLDDTDDPEEDRVPCAIEYWSDSHQSYQRYVDFYVSETDSYRLDLPDRTPLQAVACTWRIVLLRASRLSSKALVACLRVDSYFNPRIVPRMQVALGVKAIQILFYNHLSEGFYDCLPSPLDKFTLNGMIPETQCFGLLEHRNAHFHFNGWGDGSRLLNVAGDLRLNVLDYGLLTLQEVLDSARIKAQVSLIDGSDVSLTSDAFAVKLSPSTFHTLALSAHLWNNMLGYDGSDAVVLTTRYVIANDTNIPIRFGQSGTDDSILLESRQCHFYSWRHANNQVLRISVEENGWSWSKPFAVGADGTYDADFPNSPSDLVISICVSSLSASQKLVTFSGQLTIANQMADGFEMRLVKYDATTKQRPVVSRDSYHIPAKSRPPSIVLGDGSSMAMRLRFSGMANLAWTGDIPLEPNSRWGQPWLVKVPLQEKGQFISIWVRVIVEKINGRSKILAITSPLYMIRSYLPVSAKVQIETPSLKVSMNTVINGCGERQQLYCPGTFEHFHQLTFQIESGVSASNPYVPLSYSSVDQRKFFKRPEKESIQAILTELDTLKDEPKWPFLTDDLRPWIPADQPQTHVQVKYVDAGLASSTLLLELQPWALMLNTLGAQVSILSQDIELCRLPHYGIVAPPKLEGTFHVGVNISDTFYMSLPLQLVKPDWSQSFYMPRVQGLIPLEGNVKSYIDCCSSICMLSINSSVHEDMRVMHICSNYAVGNMTDFELRVATLAVPASLTSLSLTSDLSSQSVGVSPFTDQNHAIPIVEWHTVYGKSEEPFVLYISLQLENESWSCPVRVDQNLSRRCVALPNGHSTIPLVITTQEDKNTVYIMVSVDKHPQLYIENTCSFKVLVGQANEEPVDTLPDTQHFTWRCQVKSKHSCHYSMPTLGSKIPDLPNNNDKPVLMLISALPNTEEHFEKDDLSKDSVCWSRPIDLSSFPSEQVVRLQNFGDVKIIMRTVCYTTFIRITSMSPTEVTAQEIRNKIEKKQLQPSETEPLLEESAAPQEEERTPTNLQRPGSSTSTTTTFFSAQDESLETDLSISPRLNAPTKTHNQVANVFATEQQQKSQSLSASVYLQGISLVIMRDVNDNAQRIEVASLSVADTILIVDSKGSTSNLSVYVGDLQLDNQMFEHGGFDFPVVVISQKPFVKKDVSIYLSNSLKKNIKNIVENSLLAIDLVWENNGNDRVCKEISVKIAPISAYIEGSFVTLLMDYATSIVPPCFTSTNPTRTSIQLSSFNDIRIPDHVLVDSRILSHPLRLRSFVIEPMSILLSVHTSVHLYVAFDHSPLYFEAFDRKNLVTTPYRLGNALAMHYLSGAIFGVGWVVGSLEILGSPGGLAQALGSGIKDFVSMPFRGLLQGPWGFIVGVTHGSASLVKHITAGTVNSVTKLASSVARNLDRLTLDDEHLQRQEEFRRTRPQGVAQGLYQGLTGLGMNLLAAVAGLAHHPLQQVMSGQTSTRGLVTGVGLGLVGVVTKPLSGAAELVALTGQGLLQGTGWNSMPSPRHRPLVQYTNGSSATSLRYAWRLMPLLAKSHDSILHVASADHALLQSGNRAVTLVLTRQALLVVNVAEDSVEKIYPLKDLVAADHPSESTMLRLYCSTASPSQERRKTVTVEQLEVHMDQVMRARVAEFLRTSSTGIASVSTNSDDAQSEILEAVPSDPENCLTFYISSDSLGYLLSVFNVAKRQNQDHGFAVI